MCSNYNTILDCHVPLHASPAHIYSDSCLIHIYPDPSVSHVYPNAHTDPDPDTYTHRHPYHTPGHVPPGRSR